MEINWNIFKSKFFEKENKAFERLAYMLFCYEHDIKVGIFKFKNQTGIETEAIEVNGKIIGFQAKYYDTKLADNKEDIIDSLKKAKRKNSDLNKVFIYTNQELSESPKSDQKKSKYQIDIEESAKSLNIDFEWRVPSHIEKQLSVPENTYLYNWYFETKNGIVDFLNALTKHAETILFPIHTDIQYDGKRLKVDRSSQIEMLSASKSKVIILAGEGGSGKTALIKESWSRTKPLYLLKATEFNRPSVGALLHDFGDFQLSDFIASHNEEHEKTFIIDSAEKLADLDNQDVFIEFLSGLIANNWKVIFTTRNSYLDDLCFQMLQIYRLPFQTISLDNLSNNNLDTLATDFQFKLPNDIKLCNLIRNLFYLQEYLYHYNTSNNELDYAQFRNLLWQKRIQNSKFRKHNIHIEREKCFLQIAKTRCDTGNFYLADLSCSGEILSLLVQDEIIQYDALQNGYFITHDIYEEWALEKLIERKFSLFSNCTDFFDTIGSALPMRRALRSWLTTKLFYEDLNIRVFIETSFTEKNIPPFWKDELLVSILISDHCAWFLNSFEARLMENDKYYLKKIIFLLRTACKEVDDTLQKLMQETAANLNPAIVFTKPKGKGWETVIEFLFNQITLVTKDDLIIILPLLKDWSDQNRKGSTTRLAGFFSLHFYKDSELNELVHYSSEIEKQLLQLVLGTAQELKKELTEITENLLAQKYNRRDAFESLRDKVLSDNHEGLPFIVSLPELTIRLADQAWYLTEEYLYPFGAGMGMDIEQYYKIREHVHHDYHPASALQTPIYYLLHVAFPQAIQFILNFNNRAVSAYAKSKFKETVKEIEFYVDGIKSKQFISLSLWCMYRGSGSPVTPYLLQSMHMALEKKLIEIAEKTDGKNLATWLKYILIQSRSASITSVVTSVVLAYPNKLFEIALILFHQYDFFWYDNLRLSMEHEAESIYSIWMGMTPQHKIFEEERIATCKEPHRKKTLENLAIELQFFRTGEVSDDEANNRRSAILNIIDELYASIKEEESETEKNKVLRLFLARIDSRKMTPTVEHKDGKSIIHLNPELTPDLKQFSEEGTRIYQDRHEYTPLKLWAMNKFKQRSNSTSYTQYEDNPSKVLKDTQQLVEKINTANNDSYYFDECIPSFTCAALVKNYSTTLSRKDLKYCRDIIMQFAVRPLQEGYDYQISDGVEVAISTLPYLYSLFPKQKEEFNFILLFILFDTYPIGEYKRVCDYAVEALRFKLYLVEPKQANEILLCFLTLKPFLDKATNPRQLHTKKLTRLEALRQFVTKKMTNLESPRASKAYYNKIQFDKLSINAVDTAFQLLPDDTQDSIHLDFIKKFLNKYSKILLKESNYKDEDRVDHRLRNRFFRKYARFLLHRNPDAIQEWILPFTNQLFPTDNLASFISDVVSEQDQLQQYEQFWQLWYSLYPSIKQMTDIPSRHLDSIIHNYLLAWPYWKEGANEWHTLQPKDSTFFKKVCNDIGYHPAVLYSVSKLLNEVGMSFLNEGIHWIADMLMKNKSQLEEDIHPNTIYYLNHIARRFVYLNRTKIKSNRMLRDKVLILLDFLIEQGSVSGYLLREEIF
jgi:hypothetical protein